MRRRDFIKATVGVVTAGPVAARAEQSAIPVIGFLAPVWQNEELLHGFQQGLQRAGFVDGDNVSILYRSAENEMDRLPALAIDLARRGVAAIVAVSNAAAFAAKNATATIPVLCVVALPAPRLRTTPTPLIGNYSRDLRPAEWGSGVSLHGSNPEPPMSALGQKQTSQPFRVMSALPPKADIG